MKIKLVKLTKDKIEKVRNWRNQESISKYMYTSCYITPQQQENWFNKISNSSSEKYFLIVYDGEDVGLLSFNKIDNGEADWAFYLGEDFAVKRGLAIPAEFLAIEYAFNELKLNKLKCEVLDFNDKVISLHKKFGFIEVTVIKDFIEKKADYVAFISLKLPMKSGKTTNLISQKLLKDLSDFGSVNEIILLQ